MKPEVQGLGSTSALSPEQAFLWNLAHNWRQAGGIRPEGIDPGRLAELARSNAMASLLESRFRAAAAWGEALIPLASDAARAKASAERMGEALSRALQALSEAGVSCAVMKGLWLSAEVYGTPAARPGADIDLLVRPGQVGAALEILESQGYGRWWPNLLDDRFYERHHLHHVRCSRDRKVWFEVHWALDHPYTLLTIDYNALMDRASPDTFLGVPIRRLSYPDLLLSLSVHLVKHAVYLPEVLDVPDLPRLILAHGMLLNYLDVAEVIRKWGGEVDWDMSVRLAHEWGAVPAFGSVLHVCSTYLGAKVPPQVLDELPVSPSRGITARVLRLVAEAQLATFNEKPRGRLWDFLLRPNAAFILRPIRLLELWRFVIPGKAYLQRRYGVSGWLRGVRHALAALAKVARMGFDALYFAMERRRRLRALNIDPSLLRRMEGEV